MALKKYIKSFSFAINGFFSAYRSQPNLRFHVLTACLVVTASILFDISSEEWCIILLCIGLVISAELINTSIETHVDLTTPGQNPKAGQTKDIAAAAVLVASIISAVIGIIIFTPKIILFFDL